MSNRPVPAAAAGSPSTTESQLPPFQGYEHAFQHLEPLVYRAANFARLQTTLADVHDEDCTPEFRAQVVETMLFVATETRNAMDAMETHWMHLHNGGARLAFRDMLTTPEATVSAAIDAHRLLLAMDDTARDYHENRKPGLAPEEEASMLKGVETCERQERAAWATFLSVPCRSAADVQAKLAYVLDSERLQGFLAGPASEPEFYQSLRIVEAGQ